MGIFLLILEEGKSIRSAVTVASCSCLLFIEGQESIEDIVLCRCKRPERAYDWRGVKRNG